MLKNKLVLAIGATLLLGGILTPATAMAAPAATQQVSVTVKASASATEYTKAAAVLKGWPKHPYSALNAKGREEYTKAYITKSLKGATVTPVKSSWKLSGKTSAKLLIKIAHKGQPTLTYDTWMSKEHGVWKIGYTIYHF